MAQRLRVINKCPLCGDEVEQVPDAELKKNGGSYNAEMIVTKTGLKQYLHTVCWYDMISEGRPYNGKLYI